MQCDRKVLLRDFIFEKWGLITEASTDLQG